MGRWDAWIGREEMSEDRLTPATVRRLRATLDLPAASPGEPTPPLSHWLCFLPDARQSELDDDGHPRRGGFLPLTDLPRRMWAGGRLTFHASIPIDAPLVRRSTIVSVREKQGGSGNLVLVTLRHEVSAGERRLVTEEQDLVYRGASTQTPLPSARNSEAQEPGAVRRSMRADTALLFRFSALTFNAHRIHYDRAYAREREGYPDLVVQGPLLAMLLMQHWLSTAPGPVESFSFRAQRPLFEGAAFDLCLERSGENGRLWTEDQDGGVTMTAEVASRGEHVGEG